MSLPVREVNGKPVYEVHIPEYQTGSKPDHDNIGSRIDSALAEAFGDRELVLRGISATEHKGMSVDELVDIATTNGTDRTEKERKGKGYSKVECDIFAARWNPVSRPGAHVWVKKFYEGAVKHGQVPLRPDVFMVYNPNLLENVPYNKGDRVIMDAYRFKDPEHKAEALIGILKIGGK